MADPQSNLQRRGRKPGSTNKSTRSVQRLMAKVSKRVDLQKRIIELCNHSDPKLALSACRMVVEYKFGKPQERVEVSNKVDYYDMVATMRARSDKFHAERAARLKAAEAGMSATDRTLLTEARERVAAFEQEHAIERY